MDEKLEVINMRETVLPQILLGSADIRDVPVAIISAFAGYVLAKVGRQ